MATVVNRGGAAASRSASLLHRRVRRAGAKAALPRAARAAATGADDSGDAASPSRVPAPLPPTTPQGEFLTHVLSNEPLLFDSAVQTQLERLADEAETDAQGPGSAGGEESTTELVLYARIGEVKRSQRQQALQDLMYCVVLHKFVELGVDLLPPLDGRVDAGPVDLNALTKGVHSKEALEMVKEHLSSVLGGQESAFSNATIRIPKLQAAQIYAASIMFGYFLRRVDNRFQLERQLGTLPKTPEENLAALEALFASAGGDDDGEQDSVDPDAPMSEASALVKRKPSLREYVEQFDAETLAETARIVSLEGLLLAERQTGALFGSIELLQKEMQAALNDSSTGEIATPEQLMERVQEMVAEERVSTLTISMSTQTRVVLEGCAFGAFLRDCEADVDATSPMLLRPARAGPGADDGGAEVATN